ncbi:MAG: GAF domain-containing protein [Proteobacteria bacterium]|nr:GAF domain-containing protein [Pseudomonadota bacterium]
MKRDQSETGDIDLLLGIPDALAEQMAVLDERGVIRFVNRAWEVFGRENALENHGMGVSYLDVCDRAAKNGSEEAHMAAAGLRRMLDGLDDEFRIEYPCPSPREPRWFLMRARRMSMAGPIRILVTHHDITPRNQAETAVPDNAARPAPDRDPVDHNKVEQELKEALEKALDREGEVRALLMGARALLKKQDFTTSARGLFDACKMITGANAGYVALLSPEGDENEVLFLDAGGRECTVDPHLPMPIRGLREVAYRERRPVYDNGFIDSAWMEFMPAGHVNLDNVMFAPLVIEGQAVGLIGLANKPGGFTDRDVRLASAFGDLASVALREARAEEKRAELLAQLQAAMGEVKKLSGLLPICSGCKKIRNDAGYWEYLEGFIQSRSEAQFSHSLCPDCLTRLYPEFCETPPDE